MTDETAALQLSAGELIAGKYRVERVLGQGGMGLVVAAYHEQLEQRVAIKVLLPAVSGSQEIVERFLREARAAVKIHSEHVARVFDVGTHGVMPYMVMEYLEGGDVSRVIVEQGALSPRDAAAYLLEACDAVAEAHALGIVHRDLKPANLFLAARPSGKPMVKVLDFGISKSPVSATQRAITADTAIMGSPSYMSPEQLVASASVDVRSDIWSLGVVLYEMLTGKLPFNAGAMPELVGAILQGTYASVTTVRPDIPPELSAVVDRCLQKEREGRFQNVAELARALAPFASQRYEAMVERIESVLGVGGPPSSVRRGVTTGNVGHTPSGVENRTFAPTTNAFVRKRQPAWVIGPIAALAVVVAIGIGIKMRHQGPPVTSSGITHDVASAVTVTQPPMMPTTETTQTTLAPTPPPLATNLEPERDHPTQSHHTAHAAASASAAASATSAPATPAAAPTCKTVSFFDDQGNKHFKLDCH